MIVIDNKKKIGVKLQGKSSCQHNKICGHSCLLKKYRQRRKIFKMIIFAYQKTVDKKKKKMPRTFSIFLSGKIVPFFSEYTQKGLFFKFLLGYDIRIPTMILFWFQSN